VCLVSYSDILSFLSNGAWSYDLATELWYRRIRFKALIPCSPRALEHGSKDRRLHEDSQSNGSGHCYHLAVWYLRDAMKEFSAQPLDCLRLAHSFWGPSAYLCL
jgi:hypothetical protein